MADTFTPRGAPVPANSYDGWELTHRPAMLPFLAEYTNPLGETSGGWAMPEMVTEPVNALSRLLNTPAGTMPDIRDPQNQRDALTGLMALYGGNAVGGVARNALGKGVAHGLNMEAARPVAYSNAIEGAMNNPSLLRLMDDINYAGLNRRALDDYGVGYEGLSSSQEAKLRGWSDPALWSDTGKPNPVGAAVAGNGGNSVFYRGVRVADKPGPISQDSPYYWMTDNPDLASDYALGEQANIHYQSPAIFPASPDFKNPMVVDANGAHWMNIKTPDGGTRSSDGLAYDALKNGYDGLVIKNLDDAPYDGMPARVSNVSAALKPGTVRSPLTGELLFSDTGKPNPLGAALASQDPDNTNALAELLKRYGVY